MLQWGRGAEGGASVLRAGGNMCWGGRCCTGVEALLEPQRNWNCVGVEYLWQRSVSCWEGRRWVAKAEGRAEAMS